MQPVARNSDPSTSHEADTYISGKRERDADICLAIIREYPGIVAGEVAQKCQVRGSWKRISDIVNWGLVVYGEKRNWNGSRCKQQTLWPVIQDPTQGVLL